MMQVVVFDFDMTIVDSLPILRKSVMENLLSLNLNLPQVDESELIAYTPEKFAKEIEAFNQPCPYSWQELLDRHNKSIRQYVDLYEIEGSTTLQWLHKKGIGLAIVSDSPRFIITGALARTDIVFDLIMAYDDIEHGQSKTDRLRYCLEHFGCGGNELIYVGDHPNDIISAQQAGVVAVGITTGLHDENALKEFKPDFIIRSVHEIINIVEQ